MQHNNVDGGLRDDGISVGFFSDSCEILRFIGLSRNSNTP